VLVAAAKVAAHPLAVGLGLPMAARRSLALPVM